MPETAVTGQHGKDKEDCFPALPLSRAARTVDGPARVDFRSTYPDADPLFQPVLDIEYLRRYSGELTPYSLLLNRLTDIGKDEPGFLRTYTHTANCSGALGSGACRPLPGRESAVSGCGAAHGPEDFGRGLACPPEHDCRPSHVLGIVKFRTNHLVFADGPSNKLSTTAEA